MASLTYSGTYGGQQAGTSGKTTTLTASNALPSNAQITEVIYYLGMTASSWSSGLDWRLYFVQILGGSGVDGNPYDSYAMSGTSTTFVGTIPACTASMFATASISVSSRANCEGAPISYMQGISIVINYELPPPASTGELSAASVDAGSAISITLTNAQMASCTHTLLWSIGSYNDTQNLALGVDTSEFTIPLAWLNAMPNSSSGAATVKVTTFLSGTNIGYNTYSFYITAGAAIVPSISAFTATRINGDVPVGWGIYVQGKSKVQLQTTAASVYSATISSYSVSGDGQLGTSSDYTTGFINGYGTITYTVVVTDSRGKTAQTTVNITVYQYAAPTFSYTSVVRCLVGGTADESGLYAKAYGTTSISSCNSNNAIIACAIYYKLKTDEVYTLVEDEAVTNTWYIFGAGAISQVLSYDVKFVITDAFTTTNIIVTLSAALFTIFFKNGGRAIGFGKSTSKDDAIELEETWELWVGGSQIQAPLVFTFTLDKDNWTGSGPYYQTVSVTGMLATYVNNKIDVDLSATEATMIDQLESWLYVLNGDITPDDGEINAVCLSDEPTVDLPVRMVVFR